jgi:regulator of nonsense transcripts 1
MVYVQDQETDDFEDCLAPLVNGSSSVRSLQNRHARSIKVQLQLEASKATMLAELGALDKLTNGRVSKAEKTAFSYIMKFGNPTQLSDLTASFPQLADLDDIPDDTLRAAMKEITDGFDEDQKQALASLSALPDRICFVPGGPGSGKTSWVLRMAILAQSGAARCPTLYLLDINKPADDAANRMYQMCEDLCIDKAVIRVFGWPLAEKGDDEEKNDENGNDDWGDELLPKALKNADFTEGFLRAMQPILPRDLRLAPTLDERAFEVYSDEPDQHSEVNSALDNVLLADQAGRDFQADMRTLRKALIPLYHQVLSQADFVATTPVAAPRLSRIFNPELVIFDECAHARELSTMISLAYFEPKAWFFVGDHKQTEPFVEGANPYAKQLKISTMERAEKNDAVNYQLLVNHRAYGGLERLASELFYRGAMRSEKEEDDLCPLSVGHLRQYLESLTTGKELSGDLRVPRLLVIGNAPEIEVGTSFWNPGHHDFVMKEVERLLNDLAFLQAEKNERGTIMILSPYRESIHHYQGAVNKLGTRDRDMRRRVQVRTVDTAQGQEADVVFLDMVRNRATDHTANYKRLCVALTRARQAEVILMTSEMARFLPEKLLTVREKRESGKDGAMVRMYWPRSDSWGSWNSGWSSGWGGGWGGDWK